VVSARTPGSSLNVAWVLSAFKMSPPAAHNIAMYCQTVVSLPSQRAIRARQSQSSGDSRANQSAPSSTTPAGVFFNRAPDQACVQEPADFRLHPTRQWPIAKLSREPHAGNDPDQAIDIDVGHGGRT